MVPQANFNITSEYKNLFNHSVLVKQGGDTLIREAKRPLSWFGRIKRWWSHKDSRISQVKAVIQEIALKETNKLQQDLNNIGFVGNQKQGISALACRCKNIILNLKNFDAQVIGKHNRTWTSTFFFWTRIGSISKERYTQLDRTLGQLIGNIQNILNASSSSNPQVVSGILASFADIQQAVDALGEHASLDTKLSLGKLDESIHHYKLNLVRPGIQAGLQKTTKESSTTVAAQNFSHLKSMLGQAKNSEESKKNLIAGWEAVWKCIEDGTDNFDLSKISETEIVILKQLKQNTDTPELLKKQIDLTIRMHVHQVHPEQECIITQEKLYGLEEISIVENKKIKHYYDTDSITHWISEHRNDPVSRQFLTLNDLKKASKNLLNFLKEYKILRNELCPQKGMAADIR
jgi:hypothetical protein